MTQQDGCVGVHTRAGETLAAKLAVVALPLNALGGIEFEPPLSEAKQAAVDLGQASRGIKIFIHARGEPVVQNAIKPGHPFGYIDTEVLYPDGTQLLIGFGPDARDLRRDRPRPRAAATGRDPAWLRGHRRAGARLAGR